MTEAAVRFLQKHGERSLVSLGCGPLLNRLDNHVRLFTGCELEYYVAIDRVSEVLCDPSFAFNDQDAVNPLLKSHFNEKTGPFFSRVRMFPNTLVEELRNIPCRVVVCQRVLPFRHWENVIRSMKPMLVLQEDLKGCELQILNSKFFKKTTRGICRFQLQPFRPNRFIPREKNIILWRRRDYYPCRFDSESWWKWLLTCCIQKDRNGCSHGITGLQEDGGLSRM